MLRRAAVRCAACLAVRSGTSDSNVHRIRRRRLAIKWQPKKGQLFGMILSRWYLHKVFSQAIAIFC
jgi:hypothetical protein